MIEKILGGVASSIAGNLFGGSKNKGRIDYKRLVADAQAAGFNPAFALANGGGAGYAVQASSSDLNPLEIAAGSVLAAVGDYWSQEQERELLDAEIDLARAQEAALRRDAFAGPTLAPVHDVSDAQDDDAKVPDGSRENPWPMTGYWVDGDGKLHRGPNPDYALGIEEIGYPAALVVGSPFYSDPSSGKPGSKPRRRKPRTVTTPPGDFPLGPTMSPVILWDKRGRPIEVPQ